MVKWILRKDCILDLQKNVFPWSRKLIQRLFIRDGFRGFPGIFHLDAKAMIKNLKMTILGDVQGVGFRDATYWTARKLYVGSFVMDEPDGAVYIEAEGQKR